VLDEFGGTAGLVTMEDLLEDRRDILDEYERDGAECGCPARAAALPSFAVTTSIAELTGRYSLTVPEAIHGTIGGSDFARSAVSDNGRRVTGGGACSLFGIWMAASRSLTADCTHVTADTPSRQ